jgi:hypothetical protein
MQDPKRMRYFHRLNPSAKHLQSCSFSSKYLAQVREIDLFSTADLFEGSNVRQVALCVHSLGKASALEAGFPVRFCTVAIF